MCPVCTIPRRMVRHTDIPISSPVDSLMFNDKPRSRHLLCQSRTHYISNVIISGPWFSRHPSFQFRSIAFLFIFTPLVAVVAVMMALLLPDECQTLLSEDGTTWFCGVTIGECVTAWILFAICEFHIRIRLNVLTITYIVLPFAAVFVAAYIHRRSQRFGLLSNIAQSSKTHLRLDDISIGMTHHTIKGYP